MTLATWRRAIGALILLAALAAPAARATEQSSYVMPSAGPMSMATFVGIYLNPGLRALASCHNGSSAPANGPSAAPLSYQCWWDTSATPTVFKFYDGSQWVSAFTLNTSTHAFALSGGSGARALLSGNATYHVRTDGSDSNCSGLVNAADPGSGALPRACAFRNLQKAANTLQAFDMNGFTGTINGCGIDGTYTTGLNIIGPFVGLGAGTIQINGNTRTASVSISIASPGVITWNSHGLTANTKVQFLTTGGLPTGLIAGVEYFVVGASITTNTFQVSATAGGAAINTSGSQSGVHTTSLAANCLISTTNADAIALNNTAGLVINGFKLATTTSGEPFRATNATATVSNVNFGASAGVSHWMVRAQSFLTVGSYTITGGGLRHYFIYDPGTFVSNDGQRITIANTPAFSVQFLEMGNLSYFEIVGSTFAGSATGNRFFINANSVAATGGAGSSFIPGNSTCPTGCVTTAGGQFL